jgi:squalene cyclase
MKAVLEFNYPDDTDKCRRAIHADEAFDTLWDIRKIAELHYPHKADLERALRAVLDHVEYTLRTTGEDE